MVSSRPRPSVFANNLNHPKWTRSARAFAVAKIPQSKISVEEPFVSAAPPRSYPLDFGSLEICFFSSANRRCSSGSLRLPATLERAECQLRWVITPGHEFRPGARALFHRFKIRFVVAPVAILSVWVWSFIMKSSRCSR